MQKHRTWRIFCGVCGTEIWEELDSAAKAHLTISKIERSAICSNCITERVIRNLDKQNEKIRVDTIESDKLT